MHQWIKQVIDCLILADYYHDERRSFTKGQIDKQSDLLVASFRLAFGLLLVKKLCAVTSEMKAHESIKI